MDGLSATVVNITSVPGRDVGIQGRREKGKGKGKKEGERGKETGKRKERRNCTITD